MSEGRSRVRERPSAASGSLIPRCFRGRGRGLLTRCLQVSSCRGRSAMCARAARSAAPCAPSTPTCAGFACTFPGHECGELPECDFGLVSPPAGCAECSWSDPDLTLGSPRGGVRSGSRKRNAATASARAGGGTGPESRRAAPVRRGPLHGGCGMSMGDLCELVRAARISWEEATSAAYRRRANQPGSVAKVVCSRVVFLGVVIERGDD